MKLAFGRTRGIPDDVTTAWGARLIAPDDLLHDRQDLVAASDEDKAELVKWLNGGAIAKMRDWLRENYWRFRQDDEQLTIYEDDHGIIVGSTQGSGGYVYVAGWLHFSERETAQIFSEIERAELRDLRRETEIGRAHDALTVDRYEVVRGPIEMERWHTHYGWSRVEAKRMGTASSEVRVWAIHSDGSRRELVDKSGRAGEFEMGYGGTGPHNTARAIVADRDGGDRTPVDLQRLVPEVFSSAGRVDAGDGMLTLVVRAADVDARMSAVTA